MKKLFLAITAFSLSVVSANAQKPVYTHATHFNLSAEVGIPTGIMNTAGYKTGFGGSIGVSHNVAAGLDIGLRAGYMNFANKNTTPYKYHLSVIPVMANATYWFSQAVGLRGELGAAFNSTKQSNATNATSYTSTEFAYSPALIFNVSRNVQLLARYFSDGDFNWVGAGVGINLGK